jgi:hypothetical protein
MEMQKTIDAASGANSANAEVQLTKKIKIPQNTPWGEIQSFRIELGGIISFETGAHGGLKVPKKLNEKIPKYLRRSGGWYEEDCDWCIPIVIFPQFFSKGDYVNARSSLKENFPNEYNQLFKGED